MLGRLSAQLGRSVKSACAHGHLEIKVVSALIKHAEVVLYTSLRSINRRDQPALCTERPTSACNFGAVEPSKVAVEIEP